MVYESFEKLNSKYPERSDMSFDEEVSYVEDCFDTYESIGFLDEYNSPYEEFSKMNGMKFKVISRVSYIKGEADIEVLPMWHIQFEDGVKIDAYPEEICKAGKGE